MRLAALYSGGKDSTFAAYLMEQQGHAVDLLVSVMPRDPHSWVFHTPNLALVPLMAAAMGKELVTVGSSGEEKDDLRALAEVLSGLDVEGVVTGAIASDYQWDRINHVCDPLGLRVFSPLWRKDQSMLMEELISAGIRAALVTVAAEGLGPSWLGRGIDLASLAELRQLSGRYGMNVAGEGGEYETLTLDSPMHRKALRIVEAETEIARDGGALKVTKAVLEDKHGRT
jgi:diphthine-ammonia ligase